MPFSTRKQTKSLPHIIINAGPGVGKTSTMIAGLNILSGGKPEWEGTEEQKAIWAAMKGHYTSIGFQAFNKSIATEIQEKVPSNVKASTFHAFGYKVLRENGYKLKPNSNNVKFIVKDVQGYDKQDRQSSADFKAGLCIAKVVGLLKGNLLEPTAENVNLMIDMFNLTVPDTLQVTTLVSLTKKVMAKCLDVKPEQSGYMDFDDMLWLPLKLGLDFKSSKFDLLICDECFPAGTMIETSNGPVAIEQIADNPTMRWEVLSLDKDKTLNYNPVVKAYKTPVEGNLVKVKHEKGETICTANHPYWTQRGWVPAGLLESGDTLLCLPETDQTKEHDLLQQMCGEVETEHEKSRDGETSKGEDIQENESGKNRNTKSNEKSENPKESIGDVKTNRTQTFSSGRERKRSNRMRTADFSSSLRTKTEMALDARLCRIEWAKEKRGAHLLQNRCGIVDIQDSNRSGWSVSPRNRKTKTRSKEGTDFTRSKVDCVEVYQQRSEIKRDQNGETIDFVYTLSTEMGNYFADQTLVKNCQDLNPIQHELVLKSGSRLICVGDRRQSIYGFRGADSRSMDTLKETLEKTDRGVVELSLQTTFRLPISGVKNVNSFAPDLVAADNAIEGEIEETDISLMTPKVGDLILSRINANIFSMAFSLLRKKIGVRIQGRDFGNQLKKLLESVCKDCGTVAEIQTNLAEYEKGEHDRIMQRTFPARGLAELEEKMACLYSLTGGCKSLAEMTKTIDELFSEDLPRSKVVLLSTVHRAKGMEADTVWFLEPQLIPHKLAETENEIQQEFNLKFVAETRHKKKLVYVYPSKNRDDERDQAEGRLNITNEVEEDWDELETSQSRNS